MNDIDKRKMELRDAIAGETVNLLTQGGVIKGTEYTHDTQSGYSTKPYYKGQPVEVRREG